MATASRSQLIVEPNKQVNARSIKEQINSISEKVLEHFPDSKAELITSVEQLHTYIDHMILCGSGAIDTETTGLDRFKDHIVGWSLYFPDGVEIYIPCKHIVPIFDTPYKNQLTYEDCGAELQRLVITKTKLVMANADFDLAMIWKDFKVDLIDITFYDVLLAWRCLKENEQDNSLKGLYTKYVVKGEIDRMKFSDFFTPDLYPYCDPQIAKLYAAADARYTYELYQWQMKYLNKESPYCKKHKFESISDLAFTIEFPLIKVCQLMHRRGVYLEQSVADMLQRKYKSILASEADALRAELQEILNDPNKVPAAPAPFSDIKDFNPNSGPHVEWLVYDVLKLDTGTKKRTTKKEILGQFPVPIIKNILKYRSLVTLIGTFVEKLPAVAATTPDHKIHCEFKSIGAACVTGDTIIPTDRGYYTIQELCKEAETTPGQLIPISPVNIVNKDQQYEQATHAVYYKDTPTIKITTEYGFTIEGTPNHPIMVSSYNIADIQRNRLNLNRIWNNRQFKRLDELSIGDIIEIPCEYSISGEYQPTNLVLPFTAAQAKSVIIPEIYTEDFAEFLGMYHADGCAYMGDGSYRIKIANKDTDVIDRVNTLAHKLFNVDTNVSVDKKRPNCVTTDISAKALCCMDTLLCHGAHNKRIPDAIWKSPVSVINAYIRGMTLDSTVCVSEGRVIFQLSIIDETDARRVQAYLASMGIIGSLNVNCRNRTDMFTRLKFSADHYKRFVEMIGFIQSSKIKTGNAICKNKYEYRRIGNSYRVTVKSITHQTNDVYDFYVPNTHSFVGNAIISHNTGRFSSKSPNMQNIPSKNGDIRRMFRATPGYVMMSSDYS